MSVLRVRHAPTVSLPRGRAPVAAHWQNGESGFVQLPLLQNPDRQSGGVVLPVQAAPAPPCAVHFLVLALQYALPSHSP
jgi:hypothetical protein